MIACFSSKVRSQSLEGKEFVGQKPEELPFRRGYKSRVPDPSVSWDLFNPTLI